MWIFRRPVSYISDSPHILVNSNNFTMPSYLLITDPLFTGRSLADGYSGSIVFIASGSVYKYLSTFDIICSNLLTHRWLQIKYCPDGNHNSISPHDSTTILLVTYRKLRSSEALHYM